MFLKILKDKNRAKMLFSYLYQETKVTIFDEQGQELFKRQMRAYLIKDEGTLEKLAKQKFEEDLLKKQWEVANTQAIVN